MQTNLDVNRVNRGTTCPHEKVLPFESL